MAVLQAWAVWRPGRLGVVYWGGPAGRSAEKFLGFQQKKTMRINENSVNTVNYNGVG